MIRRDIAVNNSVSQSSCGFLLQRLRVRVHNPIDGAIPNRVRTHMNSSVVEERNHLAVSCGIERRVSSITFVNLFTLLVPWLVNPSRPASAASIHEDFYASGNQHVTA